MANEAFNSLREIPTPIIDALGIAMILFQLSSRDSRMMEEVRI